MSEQEFLDKPVPSHSLHDYEENIDLQELANFLRTKVPEYMVPNKFLFLDKMPLTISNKVSRKELKKLFEADE